MKQYEVVVLGAGPGGYQTALEFGKLGARTPLIDKSKEKVGGVCLNLGCVPTKNYLESAVLVSRLEHFKSSGLRLDYNGLNLGTLKEKTSALITEIRGGVLWMKKPLRSTERLLVSKAIVGAGAIACEFATFFNSFGARTIIVGRSPRLLPNEDEDVSKALARVFKRSGVEVFTSATVAQTKTEWNCR
jgi:dihydrolipoamide dehydrogenase